MQPTKTAIVYLIYLVVVVTSMFLFVRFFYFRLIRPAIVRPLALAAVLAVGVALGTGVQWLIFAHSEDAPFYLWRNMPVGFMMGLGLGVGVELALYLRGIGVGPPSATAAEGSVT